METSGYLLVQQNGSMRIVKRVESSKGSDVAIRLNINIPDEYWTTPTLSADITLPEREEEIQETSALVSISPHSVSNAKEELEGDLEDI